MDIMSCSRNVTREVLGLHSSVGVEVGGGFQVVGLGAIDVLLFDLLVLLLDRGQLLLAILLVLAPRPPGVELPAQRGPLVHTREVQLLVDWVAVGAACVVVHQLHLLVLGEQEALVVVPTLVEVVLGHELVVFDLDLLANRVALENDLLRLPTLREVLRHLALEVPRLGAPPLDALEDGLPFLVRYLLFFVLYLLDRLVHIAVVVAQLGLLVALSTRDGGDDTRALVVRAVEVLLELEAELAQLLRQMRRV